jgi:hypothetical protein
VVLHELMHFVQDENGIMENTEGHARIELGAYTIQNQWLQEHGQEPWDDITNLTQAAMWENIIRENSNSWRKAMP